MTLSSSTNRRVRQALQSPRADALASPIRFLAQAVWNVPSERTAHRRCRAKLPDYIDAEMEGTLSSWRNSFVHEHLLTCNRCAADYAELLQVAVLESSDVLNQRDLPAPDLTFLELPHDR